MYHEEFARISYLLSFGFGVINDTACFSDVCITTRLPSQGESKRDSNFSLFFISKFQFDYASKKTKIEKQ